MPNSFSKKEEVAFETLLEGFNDSLIASRLCSKYTPGATAMERSGDVIWRPMPYIANSFDGTDATANFQLATQLSVPATIGYEKHSTALMTATELRDMLHEGRLGDAAKQKLASDVNIAVMNVAANQGTLVVKRTSAATGFDDIANCEAIMNEQGIMGDNRHLMLSTRDYNGMAKELSNSNSMSSKAATAYEQAYIGRVASFETHKLDYANRLAAAAGGVGLTIDTRDVGAQYYTPIATRTAATGERSNIDNRYQTVTISSTVNVAAGDCFTIAGLNAVHHVTKGDTGQLKTFRVISVDSGTTMTISPPIITNQVSAESSARYKNCIINTKAANSAIVFLNTVAASVNPFWQKESVEIIPGGYVIPTDAGVAVIKGSIDNGIQVSMQKFYDINTMLVKYRWDIRFGVVMVQPEMAGIMLFSQT